MSFPRYPKYKDSGVEWLGEVPEGWEVRRLKNNVTLLTEKSDKRDYPVALENIESWSGRFIETDTEFQGEGVAFQRGDILFGKLRPYLAKVLLAHQAGEAVGDFHVMRPTAKTHGQFAVYQILNREFIDIIDGSTFGAKMPRVSWEFMANMPCPTPPIPEQQAIASFLDRETAKIDALIAEQENLIALLKEKRQAVISHAVTKGLDPTVPMKDSGIEWLGEVPANWEQIPVWLLFELGRGRVISHEEIHKNPGEYPVYSSQTENHGEMGCISTYDFEGNYITWTTDGANAGTVFRRHGKFNCTNVCGTLRPRNTSVVLEYMVHMISLSTGFYVRQDINPKLMNNVMARIKVLLPPAKEQLKISDFLSTETAKLDDLTTEAQHTIDLLKERRSALISAAVTGKIDVRCMSAEVPQ